MIWGFAFVAQVDGADYGTREKRKKERKKEKKRKKLQPETKQIRACGLARKRIFFNRNDDPSQKADGKLAAKIQIAKQSYDWDQGE